MGVGGITGKAEGVRGEDEVSLNGNAVEEESGIGVDGSTPSGVGVDG